MNDAAGKLGSCCVLLDYSNNRYALKWASRILLVGWKGLGDEVSVILQREFADIYAHSDYLADKIICVFFVK